MPWRLGILAALLAWLLLASPAGAAIQRRTDSRGVIHIGNSAVEPAPNNQDLSEKPGPEMASLPETAAPPAKLAEPKPPTTAAVTPKASEPSLPVVEPESNAAEKTQSDTETSGKACQNPAGDAATATPGITGMMAAAASAAAKTVTPATTAPTATAESHTEIAADTLQKVSYEAAEPEAATVPQAAPLPKATALSRAGGIQRYRDAQGVWHISNVTAGNEGEAPAGLEASKTPDPKMAIPETQPRRPATLKAGLPLQKVAWTQDYPDLATLPTARIKARTAAPEAPNLIRRYRDSKGVIHISNVEPEAVESLPAPKRRAPVPVVAEAPLALKLVAWSGEAGEKPLKLVQARSTQQTEITTEGGIKRWRDKKGIWHIETVEYPLPTGVVLPPRQAGPHPAPPAATATTPVSSPGAPAGANPTPLLAQAAPRVPTVTAFRDRQGRLKITNDAPVMLGKPPAGAAPAPAELEPIIVEAAQVHRLPPTLVRAVIKTESNFCSWAVSPKGAMGLMQLMPGTAADLGVQEPFNPRENVHGGCRYLRLLVDFFGGNVPLALAAYNAGYQRVIDCGYQVPPIKETQEFVTQVMERYVAEEHRTGQPWT